MACLPQLNELLFGSILHTFHPSLSCIPLLSVQLKDVLRRFPDVAMACLPQLNELSPGSIMQPEARAALVWILGQFGEHIQVCGAERHWGGTVWGWFGGSRILGQFGEHSVHVVRMSTRVETSAGQHHAARGTSSAGLDSGTVWGAHPGMYL